MGISGMFLLFYTSSTSHTGRGHGLLLYSFAELVLHGPIAPHTRLRSELFRFDRTEFLPESRFTTVLTPTQVYSPSSAPSKTPPISANGPVKPSASTPMDGYIKASSPARSN
jgi:hypothetical protein